jgi:N-acetylmuramoyl-L-alanine amidase
MRNGIQSLHFYFCAFFALAAPYAAAVTQNRGKLPQVPYRGELRLRLQDPVQDRRTTSLNWMDTGAASGRAPKGTKFAAVSPSTALVAPLSSEALPNVTLGRSTVRPKMKPVKIVIDAGHGGTDWGAAGYYGLLEKDLSLKTGFLLQRQIERLSKLRDIPVVVRLTRTDDYFISLKDRVESANRWRADLFISVHANSAPSKKLSGFEVYFQSPEATDDHSSRVAYVENQAIGRRVESDVLNILKDAQASLQIEQSSDFAERVYASMSKLLRPNVRGVRQAPFTVLSGAEMPALLIEVGYVTHKSEAEKLTKQHYLKRIASAISSGVFDYIARM